MQNKIPVFIPARYNSSRLPGKLMYKINNKTIIQLVYEQVLKCKNVSEIIVLTDNDIIYNHLISLNYNVKMTDENCINGTERICNYLRSISKENIPEFICNVQGDEPFIDPTIIDNLIKNKIDLVSTVHYKITNKLELDDKSIGKLVLNKNNEILYCSRNKIPYCKGIECDYYAHIGLFIFNTNYLLNEYIKENTPLQLCEDIEWLKVIEQGHKIKSFEVYNFERGINTIEDYNYLNNKYSKNNLYIGYDSSQNDAYSVCKYSIEKKSNININKLDLNELKSKNIYFREDNTGSTEFTYTRFLVPYLNNYKGWALFCDSDFLWFCDPIEIFHEYINDKYSVLCVKHDYLNCNGNTKMDGKKQEWYPKKNWSSLMLFNCNHPDIINNLNLENINTKSPQWLHRMEWTSEENIGEIDKKYNYLINYYFDNNFKALHYTDGGPWHENYKNCEFATEWNNFYNEYINE